MIDRHIFNIVINNIFTKYELYGLLNVIEKSENSDRFIIQYLNETVLIYDTVTDKFCSWYKLTHIARALHTNIKLREELEDFLRELRDEIYY